MRCADAFPALAGKTTGGPWLPHPASPSSSARATGLGQPLATLHQIVTHHRWEALVIDTASTDSRAAVMHAATQANPPLRSLLCARIGQVNPEQLAVTIDERSGRFTARTCLFAPMRWTARIGPARWRGRGAGLAQRLADPVPPSAMPGALVAAGDQRCLCQRCDQGPARNRGCQPLRLPAPAPAK